MLSLTFRPVSQWSAAVFECIVRFEDLHISAVYCHWGSLHLCQDHETPARSAAVHPHSAAFDSASLTTTPPPQPDFF